MRRRVVQTSSPWRGDGEQVSIKHGRLALALVVSVFSGLACDPGYSDSPVDATGARVPRWSQTIDGVTFEMERYERFGYPESETSLDAWLSIVNDSEFEVVVLRASVETRARTIDHPGTGWTARSKTREPVYATWDLNEPGLGPAITYVWTVRIGTAEHTVKSRMERDPD
jgi:hypothetical protein